MSNGIQTAARVNFTMGSITIPITLNINTYATGSQQSAGIVDLSVGTWTALSTSSLSDIGYGAFINDGSGSVAVRISGSATNLTYLKCKTDASLISMQSGSNPPLIATAYTSASVLFYAVQES